MSMVETTDDATINMMQLKYVPGTKRIGIRIRTENSICYWVHSPRRGTASEVAGMVSATIFKKTVNDNKIVTP